MRVGSMCSGYDGAELALESFWPCAELAWVAEVDRHASLVLAERFPGVPNLGDIKQACWERAESVDVVTAGYPCTPFSSAGKRGGLDDPRHLWPWVRDAVRVLRPRYVLLENVAAHLGLGFDRVLADLAAAGFDAEWGTLRAPDVGACHGRDRLFVVAWPAAADSIGGEPERRRGPGQLAVPA